MSVRLVWCLVAVFIVGVAGEAKAGAALDAIRDRDHLICGVSADAPGLSRRDGQGHYRGFETDMCRAVAAAIVGSAEKVEFRSIDTIQNLIADPDIDIVFHGLTWTFARESGLDMRFGPIVFYDGQSFLVKRKLGAKNLGQLLGRTVCVQGDSDFLLTLQRAYRERKMVLKAKPYKTLKAAEEGFFSGECDVLTADATELAAVMLTGTPNPEDYLILPDRISKEPLAPLTRRDDDDLFDVVQWTFFALVNAEELGVASMNIDEMKGSDDPRVRNFLAASSERAGLKVGWTGALIRAIGNYGEIYDHNFGDMSQVKLDRSLNDLWTRGGLMLAPPFK
jgi:general L-amino acid transport system substrate-binding protein